MTAAISGDVSPNGTPAQYFSERVESGERNHDPAILQCPDCEPPVAMLEIDAEARMNERCRNRARVQEHRVALECLSRGPTLALCCDAVRWDDAHPTVGIDDDCSGERGVLRRENFLSAGHHPSPR